MTELRQSIWALIAGFAMLAACGRAPDPEPEPAAVADPYPDEEANLELWLERLEVGSRELYSEREGVASALGLSSGARIADIGAGTGIYSLLFAEIVGPSGVVYAVDIAPRFLTLINQRADDFGLNNIISVLGREESITLPPASVDFAFICDTYHYLENPRTYMRTVYQALKPGGILYVVDYDIDETAPPPRNKRHVRMGKEGVAAEIEALGFSRAMDVEVSGLRENYILKFVRPDR